MANVIVSNQAYESYDIENNLPCCHCKSSGLSGHKNPTVSLLCVLSAERGVNIRDAQKS